MTADGRLPNYVLFRQAMLAVTVPGAKPKSVCIQLVGEQQDIGGIIAVSKQRGHCLASTQDVYQDNSPCMCRIQPVPR